MATAISDTLKFASDQNKGCISDNQTVDELRAHPSTMMPAAPALQAKAFRDKYSVLLAWSNKDASDDVLIRRALVTPGFQLLLDAAIEFGVGRLINEWAHLKTDAADEVLKAAPVTERILRHIEYGYQQATR